MKIILLFLVVPYLLLSNCTPMYQDFDKYGKNYRQIPLNLLSIGDPKEKVAEKLGPPVNVIGSKKFRGGIVEVWAYEKWHAGLGFDRKEEEYWLYFLNNRLEQWGRPGDWEKEADRIYEIRYR
jgi:hypothetical protein